MVLDRGRWQGRTVVPASWIVTSMKPRAFVEAGLRYGYQWWLGQLAASGRPWWAAYGNGGQRLFVIPGLKLVVVIFAGNYNAADQWKMPTRLMGRFVIPAVQDA
jgi:CubicO group peptidase (beta-lactamase class C family)